MIDRFERFSCAIAEISKCWHKVASEELARYGLKGPHATYLTVLYRNSDGITAPELCRLCGKDKADVSRTMSLMEKKGLVKKEVVNQSLYRGLLKLTDEGRKVACHISERAALATELAGRDLSDEERNIFYKSLETITDRLRELCEKGLIEI